MFKKFLFILVLFIMLPLSVNADCESDFNSFKRRIDASYEYISETDDFNIYITLPDYDKYSPIYNTQDGKCDVFETENGDKLEITIASYKKTELKLDVVALYDECNGRVFSVGTYKFSKPNKYADSQLCKGNEDFVLCQPDYDKEVDEETFESRLETYQQTKEKTAETETKDKEDKNEIVNNFMEYIIDNLMTIIVITVFIIILIITIILTIKGIKKSRRLE